MEVLRETRDLSPATYISGGFKISTVCSLQFVAVNRRNVLDVIAVYRDVQEISYLKIYRVLAVINFNNIFQFSNVYIFSPVVPSYAEVTDSSVSILPTLISIDGLAKRFEMKLNHKIDVLSYINYQIPNQTLNISKHRRL